MKIALVSCSNFEQFDRALLGKDRLERLAKNELMYNELARQLKLQGNEVIFYLISSVEKKPTEIMHRDGYKVFLVPRTFGGRHPLEFSFGMMRLLGRHYSEGRFEVAHVISYYNRMFAPLAFFFSLRGIPFVAQFFGGGLDERRLLGKASGFLLRRALGLSGAAIVSNDTERAKLLGWGIKNVFFVPAWVNLAEFSGLSKRAARKSLGFGVTEKIILFAGRLHDEHKGLSFLLKAVPLLKNSRAKLVVCGDGPDARQLRELCASLGIAEKVFFMGMARGRLRLDCFAASDLLCVPSNPGFEGMPVVALEAMACGKPVVATDCAGLGSAIADGENGFLVAPGNPGLLAEKIDLLLSSEKKLEKIGSSARKKSAGFSSDAIAKRILEIYGKVLGA